MFDWLRGWFPPSPADQLRRFKTLVDGFNALSQGGPPVRTEQYLGKLLIHSGELSLGDPQYLHSVVIRNIRAQEVGVNASLWKYPSGSAIVVGLRLDLGNLAEIDSGSIVGKLPVDSAKLVIADKDDLEKHWAAVGKDRIGSIGIARNDDLLKELQRRFRCRVRKVHGVTAEMVEPVSESLEQEIIAYLESVPEYADFPYVHFYVRTNNSFDRVNFLDEPWAFLPVGNLPEPLMLVIGTGRGDGAYEVHCGFAGESPRQISVHFINPDEKLELT